MFLLGLLSTPLPYLLLAAFYFFGFAMGLFNNKTGDEVAEPIAANTINAELKENKSEATTYFFVENEVVKKQVQAFSIESKFSIALETDTGPSPLPDCSHRIYDFDYISSLFCRPPPALC